MLPERMGPSIRPRMIRIGKRLKPRLSCRQARRNGGQSSSATETSRRTLSRFRSEDGPKHTSTDDPDWETPQTPAILPTGAQKWRTKFLSNGNFETHTFTVQIGGWAQAYVHG